MILSRPIFDVWLQFCTGKHRALYIIRYKAPVHINAKETGILQTTTLQSKLPESQTQNWVAHYDFVFKVLKPLYSPLTKCRTLRKTIKLEY